MRTLTRNSRVLAVAMAFAGSAAHAADGIQDSYCSSLFGLQQSDPAPWIVDDDVNDRINFLLTNMVVANADVEQGGSDPERPGVAV